MRKTDFHMQRMKRHEYKIERIMSERSWNSRKNRTGTECKRKQGNEEGRKEKAKRNKKRTEGR